MGVDFWLLYHRDLAAFGSLQYCREQDRQMLIDLYYQDDRCAESANIHVQDALKCETVSVYLKHLLLPPLLTLCVFLHLGTASVIPSFISLYFVPLSLRKIMLISIVKNIKFSSKQANTQAACRATSALPSVCYWFFDCWNHNGGMCHPVLHSLQALL